MFRENNVVFNKFENLRWKRKEMLKGYLKRLEDYTDAWEFWKKSLCLRRHSGEKFGESLCMRNILDRLLEKESVRQQN